MSRVLDVRFVLITLSTLFAVGIAAVMGFQMDRARKETLADGFREARNLASTLAQHTRQSITAVDLVLAGLGSPQIAPILFDRQRAEQAYTVLHNRAQVLPGVFSVVVLDASGHVVATSSRESPAPIDLSQRPGFMAAKDSDDLVISPPVVSEYGASKGQLVLVLSRRVNAPDGKFLGVIEASFGLEYLKDFYSHLDLGRNGLIGVVRHDGILVIRYPIDPHLLGQSAAKTPVYEAYRRGANQGELFATYVNDKLTRLTAFRDVPEIELVVSVGLAVDNVLAGWRRSAMIESAAGTAVILLLALLTYLANRLLAGQASERELFAERLNRLAAASAEIAAIHTGAGLAEGLRRTIHALVPGAAADIRFAVERSGATSQLELSPNRISVPLRAKAGRIFGTLNVSRAGGPPFNEQDAAVLSQLGFIGTVALENIELLAESQRLAVQAERARAEEAEARRRIEDVFATMSEGVYTLDHEGRFTFLNDNAVAMLLRPREQLVGRSVWEVFPRMRGTELEANLRRVEVERTPIEFELEYETSGGTRWMDIRAFATADGVTVYIRDITQRVETEGKLRQAQKMEAIGQLTGGIAHDFNNLLTVVLGNIDLLVDALGGNARLRRIAEVARDAALRGATLVARLLAFARRQALAPRPVDVNALTRNVEDLLQRTIGENVQVAFKRTEDLWRANIDPTQMENAILNLALNARDAMPEGGTLTIETANAHLNAGEAEDTQIVPGEYVMVAVSDTGTGMTADVRSRAFDPFFTTKPVGQGSGLGLSMVYGFVRQSGGYVRIDSEVGRGTSVRMYLPRAVADSSVAAKRDVVHEQSGHETILLVEDDELVREHLSETLKSLGYAIIPCATGREAVDVIRSGGRADLLLTDVMLAGGVNGHGVAQSIKALRPRMPVLYMSGYTEDAVVGGNLGPGLHFLAKPFRRQEIAAKLREVLADAGRSA